MNIKLVETTCAICGTADNATEMYPANFDPTHLNAEIFSARRLPDGIHYRLVKCNACGLVRSDPVADGDVLAELYAVSTFDYGSEVENLKKTYGRYLAKLDRWQKSKGSLLEIGSGNGFFLEQALTQGYKEVKGVEPSHAAAEQAAASVREALVTDMMRPGLFPANSFDVVCLFQVFDHIGAPGELLAECFQVLRPGGLLLCLNHNVESFSAKILKEKSPIIDIEHTYLYSPATLSKLVEKLGFAVVESGSVWNTYSLSYLARLLPLPKKMKLRLSNSSLLKKMRASVPLGNLYVVARKPEANPGT